MKIEKIELTVKDEST